MKPVPSNLSDGSVESFAGKRVWITGHKGMLGSAMVRGLAGEGADLIVASRADLDLTDQTTVLAWMQEKRPDLVFHIGAKVGGIHANSTQPADFLRENLLIQSSVIDGAYRTGVGKLVFVASNCTYPVTATQPISESSQLSGPLEENIRSYAVSKIAGIEMCRAYRKQFNCNFVAVIPPNLYGPGDNYHSLHSHVVAGILRRAHEAKVSGKSEFVVWGDGTPRRELLHVDDLASAMKYVMKAPYVHDLYNIGCGRDLAISDIAALIVEVVGFKGKIVFDTTKPNGSMGKLLDSTRINSLGWVSRIDERAGLRTAYEDFLRLIDNPGAGARID
jgi:GDP-L-fucose synthase